jgi:hypothetical protein
MKETGGDPNPGVSGFAPGWDRPQAEHPSPRSLKILKQLLGLRIDESQTPPLSFAEPPLWTVTEPSGWYRVCNLAARPVGGLVCVPRVAPKALGGPLVLPNL